MLKTAPRYISCHRTGVSALVGLLLIGLYAQTASAQIDEVPPPDPNILLNARAEEVTPRSLYNRAIEIEENYQRYHQAYGVVWPAFYADPSDPEPTQYLSGGDSALYTGFYLATATYRFLVTGREEDLDLVLQTLGGLHLLTHISGTPGVLVRCAFPVSEAAKFGYPKQWTYRMDRGEIYTNGPDVVVPNILTPGANYPEMIFFTRTTRDQFTGVLFGLSVLWAELDPDQYADDPKLLAKVENARTISELVTRALWTRLVELDFYIRDHEGQTGTSSKKVSGLLRLQLAALYRAVAREADDPVEMKEADDFYDQTRSRVLRFGRFGNFPDRINRFNNLIDYYAWNLRFARAFSVWLLEDDPRRKRTVGQYIKRQLWRHVSSHHNTFFTFIHNAVQQDDTIKMDEALQGLKELSLRPQRMWDSPLYGQKTRPNRFRLLFCNIDNAVVPAHLRQPSHYFQWQTDPYTVGRWRNPGARPVSTGLGTLFPYWFGRHYGFVAGLGSD